MEKMFTGCRSYRCGQSNTATSTRDQKLQSRNGMLSRRVHKSIESSSSNSQPRRDRWTVFGDISLAGRNGRDNNLRLGLGLGLSLDFALSLEMYMSASRQGPMRQYQRTFSVFFTAPLTTFLASLAGVFFLVTLPVAVLSRGLDVLALALTLGAAGGFSVFLVTFLRPAVFFGRGGAGIASMTRGLE
jgi:hypothetical protein